MIITKHKNVNSKRFVAEIDEFIVDELSANEEEWNDGIVRDMSLELFDLVMFDYKSEGKIDHFKCYSDHRNNNTDDENAEIYTCTIEFQQSHCFNTTTLNYTFGRGLKPDS